MTKPSRRTRVGRWNCIASAFSIAAPQYKKFTNATIAARWMPITRRYMDAIGVAPNYVDPASYTEKMLCRKLFDRNSAFPIFCDKLATREYVAKLGYAELLPTLLWSGTQADEIPFDDLVAPYIVKPNHRSGYKIVVQPGHAVDRQEVRTLCRRWLRRPHGRRQGEWGYSRLKGRILIERLLPPSEGDVFPEDYKFMTFSGRVAFIRVDSTRYNKMTQTPQTFSTLFDRDWNRLPWREWIGWKPEFARPAANLGKIAKPRCMAELVEIAEHLATGFDHLRVDLFVINYRPFVGELTVYHGSGTTYPFPENAVYDSYPPRMIDWRNGDLWDQPKFSLASKLIRVIFS